MDNNNNVWVVKSHTTALWGLVTWLFYTLVVPFVFPEWILVTRVGIPVIAFSRAFSPVHGQVTHKLLHIFAPIATLLALSIQITCAVVDASDSEWGRANGCESHTAHKVIILAFHSAVDLIESIYFFKKKRTTSSSSMNTNT